MHRLFPLAPTLVLLLVQPACSETTPALEVDAGDTGVAHDAGVDAASGDAGRDGSDPFRVQPLAGTGAISESDASADAADGLTAEEDAGQEPAEQDAGEEPAPMPAAEQPYGVAIADYSPGSNAGYGQDQLPGVVLGPPDGRGVRAGSLDVLSLGVGGSIVVDLGEYAVIDGDGPDLIIFENAFWAGGDPEAVFAELGEVAVSDDLSTWHVFECDPTAGPPWPGCAGWSPTLDFDPATLSPLDPAATGGDAFDLADVGATRARYVRITDLSEIGSGNNAGFDLDAVGVVHFAPPPSSAP